MDLKAYCPAKLMSAEDAVGVIKRGSRVFIGTGCGEPQQLIRSLVEDDQLQDIMIYQMLSHTLSKYVDDPTFLRRFSLKLFFISQHMRKAAFEGKIDYLPMYLSQIPRFFASQRIGLDVALVRWLLLINLGTAVWGCPWTSPVPEWKMLRLSWPR